MLDIKQTKYNLDVSDMSNIGYYGAYIN